MTGLLGRLKWWLGIGSTAKRGWLAGRLANSPSRHFGLAEKHEQYVARGSGLWRVFECKFWSGSFGFGMGDVIFWVGAAPAQVLDVDSA